MSRRTDMVFAALLCGSLAHADPGPRAAEVLQRAFQARYECAVSGVVAIETRKGASSTQRRKMDVASKEIARRLHTYAVFREPPHVRGVAFLGIEGEAAARSEERFVYLPSLRKIRRVSGSQSDDAFLGTDLSYHDFERQREASFRVEIAGTTQVGAEEAWLVIATPHAPSGYERVEHAVARRDYAILATRYFKRGADVAYKSLSMDRTRMVERGACRVPTRIRVEDAQRGTSTTLDVGSLTLNADLPDDLFSMTALETKRPIPGVR